LDIGKVKVIGKGDDEESVRGVKAGRLEGPESIMDKKLMDC
jgi:hypothetical protein